MTPCLRGICSLSLFWFDMYRVLSVSITFLMTDACKDLAFVKLGTYQFFMEIIFSSFIKVYNPDNGCIVWIVTLICYLRVTVGTDPIRHNQCFYWVSFLCHYSAVTSLKEFYMLACAKSFHTSWSEHNFDLINCHY